MNAIIKKISSDMDAKSLVISIQGALQSQDPESELLDLLGFDNIEVIAEVIENRDLFDGRDLILQESRTKEYYDLLVTQFAECFGLPEAEARVALYKNNYDIDAAVSQYADRFIIDYIEEQREEPPDPFPNTQFVANCMIVDHDKPIPQFTNREIDLDLHGYQVKDAIELFREKYTDLVYRVQDGRGNIRLNVITGRGLHSDGLPMIKLHLIGLLRRNSISFSVRGNGGIISVVIKKGSITL